MGRPERQAVVTEYRWCGKHKASEDAADDSCLAAEYHDTPCEWVGFVAVVEPLGPGWCLVDDCPSTICNGPHVAHTCPNGDTVTVRFDNNEPCMFCGQRSGEQQRS